MAKTTVLTDRGYERLVKDLRSIIRLGKKRAERAASQELVQTYWDVGKRIVKEELTESASYGDSIYEDLAEDLATDTDTLRRSVAFFELYPNKSPEGENLTWSHYRELVKLADAKERKWYEDQVEAKEWTRDELVLAMKRDAFLTTAGGKKKQRVKLKRPTDASFTYKSAVEHIVDGDTIIGLIDLGFEVHKSQRLRFAHVDTEPVDTDLGYKAYEFVRDRLAKAPFIVVRSQRGKLDVYGRYIANIFYAFKKMTKEKMFETGHHLNQELLDRGFAKRM